VRDGKLGAGMPIKVKICGLTNVQDALVAVEAGADALGFVFWERSPRWVAVEQAAEIVKEVPGHVLRTGVFVDPSPDLVMSAIGRCGLNLLQFHGEESPEFCLQFGMMSMKAFRIRDAASLEALTRYPTDAWLLDAYTPGVPGGTGASFDWALALEAGRNGRPVFLAGGLKPENVAEAIRCARPYGVDVSSGVEHAPGIKDHAKVRAFLAAARGGDS
jgi:phosphoribosylanthranilate isomerase